MAEEQQPQGDAQPSPPAPEPAPVQADPAPVTADPRLIEVKEFSELPDAMSLTGDAAPRGGGDGGDDG